MPEPSDHPDHLSIDITDHGNGVGTVDVRDDICWLQWEIRNSKGNVLQNHQEQRDAMNLRTEMIVVLKFLLATADAPLSVFSDSVTVWALTNRKAIKKALDELSDTDGLPGHQILQSGAPGTGRGGRPR